MMQMTLDAAQEAVRHSIARRATRFYRRADLFARDFARFKLRVDPLFADVLVSGALGHCRDLVDLGCGQGLLTAWLLAAREQHDSLQWPANWAAPPAPHRTRGFDLRPASIRRAQAALGDRAEFRLQDIRDAALDGADGVALLDVIHYLTFDDQRRLLQRIRCALPAGGTLVMRVADAGSGFSYRLAQWIDHANDLVRDGHRSTFHCRSVADWVATLRDCGFDASPLESSTGKSFSNTVLVARAA